MPLPNRNPWARSRLVTIVAACAFVAGTVALASPAHAATVEDPERTSSTVTNWGWHADATAATVSAFLAQGYRIVDLEVTSASPRFSVSYVKNAGIYARASWWYYGLTASQVSTYLTTNNARLTDIEPYITSGGLRFAVVMVANTGVSAKGWYWFYNQSSADINAFLAGHSDYRLVSLNRYATGSGDRFAVIYIANTGVDTRDWWVYYDRTPAEIAALLNTNKARLIEIEQTSIGTYDVIMTGGSSPNWWWVYGKSAKDLENAASQFGARIVKVEPYKLWPATVYSALFINDADSETTRIRNLVSGQMVGSWGFYVKRVGGPVIVGLQPDRVFEPASMIKIVHSVRALREVQSNKGTTLKTKITWYAHPDERARYPNVFAYGNAQGMNDAADKDVCAYNSSGLHLTSVKYSDMLGAVIIAQTLQQSDNRTTDALTRRYGFASLNALIDLAGMTRSELRHRVGCKGPQGAPRKGPHNDLTLRDAGRIYEGVDNLTLLDATRRADLYRYLPGGQISQGGALAAMIREEGLAAGLTYSERIAFTQSTFTRSKGGSYGLCPDGGGSCNPPTSQVVTVGGILRLPFKNGSGDVVFKSYVYGRFINATVNCGFTQVRGGSCNAWNKASNAMERVVSVEMFRAAVRQAMATW